MYTFAADCLAYPTFPLWTLLDSYSFSPSRLATNKCALSLQIVLGITCFFFAPLFSLYYTFARSLSLSPAFSFTLPWFLVTLASPPLHETFDHSHTLQRQVRDLHRRLEGDGPRGVRLRLYVITRISNPVTSRVFESSANFHSAMAYGGRRPDRLGTASIVYGRLRLYVIIRISSPFTTRVFERSANFHSSIAYGCLRPLLYGNGACLGRRV